MTQLQNFIDKMPHGKADEFRNKVVETCGITQSLFRMWRRGMTVPEKYQNTIDRIALEMFQMSVFKENEAAIKEDSYDNH